jgi:UDP-galactopyranose mutase
MFIDSPRPARRRESPLPPGFNKHDLICFSHLRWDFVFQRPQHLLKRAAKDRRVYFVEEPVFDNGTMRLEMSERDGGVKVVVPHLPNGLCSEVAHNVVMRDLLRHLFKTEGLSEYVFWYYTPMALSFTSDLKPRAVIYDCMDELSAFKNAPTALRNLEQELFQRADLVFTGGRSLYSSKKSQHHAVHCFPSSIDRAHFMEARAIRDEPEDQRDIPHPRLGFFGVIDERFDVELLDEIAMERPDWNFILLGPVVKIDPATLPRHKNIYYLGGKNYQDLPRYIAGWDVALLLFAENEATRFISPTKTPEYLAAGRPVVSTPIVDVVSPYGDLNLVQIAKGRDQFIDAIEGVLNQGVASEEWLKRVDDFLSLTSWDDTWAQMSCLIDQVIEEKSHSLPGEIKRMTTHAGTTI